MDDYLSEKEQIQQIRKWWSENGPYIIAGLVIGVLGLVGWNYWQDYRSTRAQNASIEYEALAVAVESGDQNAANVALATLKTEYSMTPYLPQARLMMARLAVEQGDAEEATTQLRAAVAETDDAELAQVARIRLARVLLSSGDTDGALAALDLAAAGVFAARFHELRGDIFGARGDTEAARESYGEALAAGGNGLVNPRSVQMKLDALPAAEVEEAPDAIQGDS